MEGSQSHIDIHEEKPSPGYHYKDRGRAWLVAIAGTVTLILCFGTFRSLGIIFVELIEVFDAQATETSLLFSSFGISYTISALLLNTALGGVFHERALVAISAIVGCLGFSVIFVATRIEHVTITLGLCLGIASQTGASSSLSIAGRYFDKRLTLATGIVVSGSSIGVFTLPVLVRFLLNEYTYRGASLILGGLMLNCLVCASLMVPVPGTTRVARTVRKTTTSTNIKTVHFSSDEEKLNIEENKSKTQLEGKLPPQHGESLCSQGYETSDSLAQGRIADFRQAQVTNFENRNLDNSENRKVLDNVNLDFHHNDEVVDISRSPSFCERLLEHIRQFVLIRQAVSRKKVTFCEVFALGMCRNPVYVLFQLYCLFVAAGSGNILQFYPAVTREMGFTHYQSAFLLSITGLSGLVGRLGAGFLGDYFTKRYRIVLISQVAIGFAAFLGQFATTFLSQVFYAIIVGVNVGVPYIYRITLMRDFFGSEDLAKIIGVNFFAEGIGVICGNPIIGWLRDTTNGYLIPMYFIGSLCILNGPVLLCMAVLKR